LFKGNEIFEKKVGILGIGRLGKITAHYFSALGADVYGYDAVEFDDNNNDGDGYGNSNGKGDGDGKGNGGCTHCNNNDNNHNIKQSTKWGSAGNRL
jgi:hypothetical protein